MIECILGVALYGIVVICLTAVSMFKGVELVFVALFCMPLYAYARSNKRWPATMFSIMAVASGCRYFMVPYMLDRLGYYPGTLHMGISEVARGAGVLFIGGIFVYLLVVAVITMLQISKHLKDTPKEAKLNLRPIRLAKNLMYGTTSSYVLCIVIGVFVYDLQYMVLQCVLAVLLGIVVYIGHSMYIKAAVKDWFAPEKSAGSDSEEATDKKQVSTWDLQR